METYQALLLSGHADILQEAEAKKDAEAKKKVEPKAPSDNHWTTLKKEQPYLLMLCVYIIYIYIYNI